MKGLNAVLITGILVAVSSFAVAQHGHSGGAGMGAGHAGGMGHGSLGGSNAHSNQAGGKSTGGGKSISDHLASNTKLSAKLQSLLPAGTDLNTAATGFKNLGQFVAAVHVSHNLGIPFDQLKTKMTGDNSESLGKAIHDLKPAADSKAASKKGNQQAKDDLNETAG